MISKESTFLPVHVYLGGVRVIAKGLWLQQAEVRSRDRMYDVLGGDYEMPRPLRGEGVVWG